MRLRTMLAVVAACGATGAAAVDAGGAARKRVPNVVGMNHQAAQNRLQLYGFRNLRERDCSGKGRLLIFDRNWRVRSQDPRAGRRVSTSRRITLCSVKIGE